MQTNNWATLTANWRILLDRMEAERLSPAEREATPSVALRILGR